MEALMAYSWPGNVRQLENWIEQAVVLADGDILDLEHFPSVLREGRGAAVPQTLSGLTLRELERWYILDTLQKTRWNRSKAARLLGISLRGLQYKLKRYAAEDGTLEGIHPVEVLPRNGKRGPSRSVLGTTTGGVTPPAAVPFGSGPEATTLMP